MSNFDNYNMQFPVGNRIDNSVNSLTNSVSVFSNKLLTSLGSGDVCQFLNLLNYPEAIFSWNVLNFIGSRRLDKDIIFCHASSDP